MPSESGADQGLNRRTIAHADGTITVDGVPVARWRDVPRDERPHVEREVARWLEQLQAVARGGMTREERLRRERAALRLLPLVVEALPDAPDEPHFDLAIAKDLVAYWHFTQP